MTMKTVLMSAAAALWLAAPVFADGGPVPEPAAPPPPAEPAPEYAAPEPEPAPPPPAEEYKYYVEGFGGASFAGDLHYGCCDFEMETGWNIGGAIGAHVDQHWDIELDIFYARMGYGDCAALCQIVDFEDSLSGLSVMLDLIYNFNMDWGLDPYLGAGFGVTRVGYDGGDDFAAFTGSDWHFGYQLMGGLLFHFEDGIDVFAEYRFHDVARDSVIEGVEDIEYRSHNVSGGVRFNF